MFIFLPFWELIFLSLVVRASYH